MVVGELADAAEEFREVDGLDRDSVRLENFLAEADSVEGGRGGKGGRSAASGACGRGARMAIGAAQDNIEKAYVIEIAI
jgi:hypothetical protein